MTHAKNIFTYMLALFSMLAMTGCSFEDENAECQGNGEGEKMQVELRLTASANSLTRSYSTSDGVTRAAWQDQNAADEGEMMHNCFVVIVQGGKIQSIVQRDFTGEVEKTEIKAKVDLGSTTFYSFANIQPSEIGLAGINSFPADLPAGFDGKYYQVNGNTATIGSKGIPMSNKQTVTITDKKQSVDLEVIRMMAKVELNFTNDTGYDLNIKNVTLTDITDNIANNVSLLPKIESNKVVPNINPNATYNVNTVQVGKNLADKAKLTTTFYVNESTARNPKYFVLSIDTDKGTVTKRIAMTEWNQIVRNDYLVIPIKLVDYRIEIEPQVFTAIGVMPEVKYEDNLITATFKSYGEFHLKLHVFQRSNNTELSNWTVTEVKTLEADPAGDEGTSIYDEEPYFEKRTKMIEGYISPRKGYAIHQIKVKIDGVVYEIPYRLQIIKE